ncbi:MAG: DUF6056 family protein [Kofleriaceae bacterium]|nr:DUF6056 family protein [Kofleriaceae bacterium]
MKKATWLWLAILIPLGIVIALCSYWEPVMRDGWGHLHFYREGRTLDVATLWELAAGAWRYENPRLGQTVTTILHHDGPLHVIVTTTVALGVFTLLTTMALGRWLSLRRGEDALAFVTVTAIVAWCVPQFGPMLFYRPFFANYVVGLFLQLLWLVPFRLQLVEPRAWRVWWSPLLFALGLAAGMCNEHVGPAFIGAGALVTGYCVKRGDGVKPWMLLGLVGLIVGYALLMLAPGQTARYGGLAQQAGALERILDRGIAANVRVLGALGLHLMWALPWLVLGVVGRRVTSPAPLSATTRLAFFGLAAMGLLTTLVLLGSPKIGPRLYLHSVSLLACALAAGVLAQLATARLRLACAVLSSAMLAYIAIRCVAIYSAVGPVGQARIAAIRGAAPGATLVVPRYPAPKSHYFLGEDFEAPNLRAAIAGDYGLTAIELAPAVP